MKMTPGGSSAVPWLVHAYTASGAVLAFAAVLAIWGRNYRAALIWLFVATVVDSTDGVLARQARVRERLPNFDGGKLDDIVDYLTFVFVPALLAYESGLVPPGWPGWVTASTMLLSSTYGFSRVDAKTADNFFTGFPSYWNIVVFYLYAAGTSATFNVAVILVLSVLVFVPIGYVYPTKTTTLRRLTLGLGLVWGLVVGMVTWRMPEPSPRLLLLSLVFPLYYGVLSLLLNRRRS